MIIRFLFIFTFIFYIKLSYATIIFIPENYQTISNGIGAASDGDTVLVSQGTYNEQLDFMGKNITVASLFLIKQNNSYIKKTIITHFAFPLVKFDSGETTSAILNGFTLTGANVAIWCSNSNPILKNLNISNNIANFIGAGILCENSSNPIIINCTIANNSLVEPTVHGGAIIARNDSHPTIVNSIVWNNTIPQISLWHWDGEQPSSITIAYSDIEGGGQNIELYDGTINWLQGNIDTDPLFLDVRNHNFTLQPESPCINKGIAFFILVNDTLVNIDSTRYYGIAPDMGAFEYGLGTNIYSNEILSPRAFLLYQNFPNPFNQSTTIKFNLPKSCSINLKIYNLVGQAIETLLDGYETAGEHQVKWITEELPSGIYFYRMQAGEFSETKKLILQK